MKASERINLNIYHPRLVVMVKSFVLCFILFVLSCANAFSQCVALDFDLPETGCLQENIYVRNAANNGTYAWDFCTGDFNNAPSATLSFAIGLAAGRPGFDLAKDGNTWYGFFTGTTSNLLFRVTFGAGLNSAPTSIENLGNLGGMLDSPGEVRIVNENGFWFGLIHNTGTGDLVKLDFGSSLSSPVTTSLLNVGVQHNNGGFGVGRDVNNGWVCVFSNAANQLTIVRLGTTISSPQPSDILTSSTVPATILGDVEVTNICGYWYAFATDFASGRVFRAVFGTNLFSVPTIDLIANLPVANLGRLRFAKDGENGYLFLPALDGTFFKLSFGDNLNTIPVVYNEGNVGGVLPPNIYAIAVAKEESEWAMFTSSQGTGNVFKISYPNFCAASPQTSMLQNPAVVFSNPSSYEVSLDFDNGTVVSTRTKTISITSANSPDIDFTSENICVNSPVSFSAINSSGNLTGHKWDFGDLQLSTEPNPSITFTTPGIFSVVLEVTAVNGCSNTKAKTITIYNPPSSDFIFQGLSPLCTNQEYSFLNTSTFDAALSPLWEWQLEGGFISSDRNLATTFLKPGSQNVTLKASIPGCSTEFTRIIEDVKAGPLIDFSVGTLCEAVATTFANLTSGAVTGYRWYFGDGEGSSVSNPIKTYFTPGNFQVTLEATNSEGCQNSKTQAIQVYSQPQPNFSLDLPPFSCAGTPSQFNDLTPAPDDSNIAQWQWNFGVAGATSANQNPTYTYTAAGEYDVSLTTTTNFGCQASTQKRITIAPSPSANFTAGAACVNQGTQFQATGTDIKSWQWTILTSTYNLSAPLHVFTSPGEFTAALTVVGDNDCIASANQLITVPIVPTLDFSATNLCAGQAANFQDATGSFTVDPIVSRNWSANNQSAAMGSQVSYTFNDAGNYSVALTTIHQSGCTYTLSKSIAIAPVPVANFSATPEWGVPPLNVQFNNSSSGASAYLWKFNDAMGSTSTAFSPTFIFTQLGEYVVDLTATNAQGCSTSKSQKISVVIPSFDLSLEQLEITDDPNTSAKRLLVTIKNQSNFPVASVDVTVFISGASAIRETLNTTLQPGASVTQLLNSQILNSTPPLSYLCVELDGSDDQDLVNNKRCESVNAEPVLFSPYPNPASNFVGFDWIATSTAALQVLIYNQSGQLVYEKTVTPENTGLIQVSFDLRPLTAGLYFMKLVSSQYSTTRTFAIVR